MSNSLDTTVAFYGVSQQTHVENELDRACEELKRQGFTVLPSGFDAQQLEAYRQKVIDIYHIQMEEVGGREVLAELNELDVARCMLAYDDSFLRTATHPVLMALMTRLLGENFVLLQQNAVLNQPGGRHHQAKWHRDLSYQHFVCNEPVGFNALLCLDPFNDETGGTYVVQGSHLFSEAPSTAYIQAYQQAAAAQPGDYFIIDMMLYHRTGYNASKGPRRAVGHVIGKPFLQQQVSIPAMLGNAAPPADPFLARYLGYQWCTAPSVTQWRRNRLINPAIAATY